MRRSQSESRIRLAHFGFGGCSRLPATLQLVNLRRLSQLVLSGLIMLKSNGFNEFRLMQDRPAEQDRVVMTGVGLTAPNGNSLNEFRASLLAGRSGVVPFETRYMGDVLAGVCDFDELRVPKA